MSRAEIVFCFGVSFSDLDYDPWSAFEFSPPIKSAPLLKSTGYCSDIPSEDSDKALRRTDMSLQVTTSQATRRAPIEFESNQGLRTDSLMLRPLGYADETAFNEALERSREPLRRWIPLEVQGQSASDYFQHQVQKAIEGDKSNTACRRAVFLNDNTFVGMVNLIKIERGMEWTAEVNYWIDTTHAGKGLATKAIEAILDHAFADMPMGLGLHKVRAQICLDNHASVRVAEKLGFTNSGQTDLLEVNNALIMHHEFSRTA